METKFVILDLEKGKNKKLWQIKNVVKHKKKRTEKKLLHLLKQLVSEMGAKNAKLGKYRLMQLVENLKEKRLKTLALKTNL